MKKISSKYMLLYKNVFPLMWFGFLGFFILLMIAEDPLFIFMPCAMALMGYFLMKKLVWDLVDEVYDCEDYLLIKNRGQEDMVPLSNIMNVSASTNMSPPRVTLRLINPGRFGHEISLSPIAPFSLNPFAKNAIAEDLIIRVDKSRSKRKGG